MNYFVGDIIDGEIDRHMSRIDLSILSDTLNFSSRNNFDIRFLRIISENSNGIKERRNDQCATSEIF